MAPVLIGPEHARQHPVEARPVGREGHEIEPMLGERAVRDAAPPDRQLVALLVGDLDPGDVGRWRLGIALQLVVGLAVAVLPWLIALSVIAGVAAGISAGLVLRRRLPPRNAGPPLPSTTPLGSYRIRRPRGPVWRRWVLWSSG